MKRLLGGIVAVAFCLIGVNAAHAQYPGPQGPMMFSSSCVNSPQFGFAQLCFDTTTGGFYTWNTTSSAFVGASRDLLMGGGTAVLSTSVANYTSTNGNMTPAAAAAEGNALQQIPFATKIKKLSCQFAVAGGTITACGGTNYVVAVRKNQADTALTCTCTASLTGCTDTTDTISFAANDVIDLGFTPNGTPTALIPKCTVEADF